MDGGSGACDNRKRCSGSDYTEWWFRLSTRAANGVALHAWSAVRVAGVGGAAEAEARPLRADARRNRELILGAARECFAQDGADAGMDDIARRAGLGVGTLYRHFPDKAALLEAIRFDRFQVMADLGHDALAATDPWEGFATWLVRCAEVQAEDRGLCEALAATPPAMESAASAADDTGLSEMTARVVARGQQAGVIRPDLRPQDIPLIMCGASATILAGSGPAGGSWRRHLAIVLDGMRAAGAPLPD